jgi:hypothetical protein
VPSRKKEETRADRAWWAFKTTCQPGTAKKVSVTGYGPLACCALTSYPSCFDNDEPCRPVFCKPRPGLAPHYPPALQKKASKRTPNNKTPPRPLDRSPQRIPFTKDRSLCLRACSMMAANNARDRPAADRGNPQGRRALSARQSRVGRSHTLRETPQGGRHKAKGRGLSTKRERGKSDQKSAKRRAYNIQKRIRHTGPHRLPKKTHVNNPWQSFSRRRPSRLNQTPDKLLKTC